nr:reverse transcriptase domain-containing protein [Tanacetum cinerariifolium]
MEANKLSCACTNWNHTEAITRVQLNALHEEFWDAAQHYGSKQSRYGLLHEMNRSESRRDNHWQSGITARLGEENKNWVEELSHVLLAHRTLIKSSHGDTPFSLTYGTKAVIPVEIGMHTYRTAAVDIVYNDEELLLNLDLLEERCERTTIREAKAKLKITKYYNARVRGVTFRVILSTSVMTPVKLCKEGS